jgi:hypothetical protein
VEKKEINVTVTSAEPVPGFMKLDKPKLVLKASYKPIRLKGGAERERDLTLIQVRTSAALRCGRM